MSDDVVLLPLLPVTAMVLAPPVSANHNAVPPVMTAEVFESARTPT